MPVGRSPSGPKFIQQRGLGYAAVLRRALREASLPIVLWATAVAQGVLWLFAASQLLVRAVFEGLILLGAATACSLVLVALSKRQRSRPLAHLVRATAQTLAAATSATVAPLHAGLLVPFLLHLIHLGTLGPGPVSLRAALCGLLGAVALYFSTVVVIDPATGWLLLSAVAAAMTMAVALGGLLDLWTVRALVKSARRRQVLRRMHGLAEARARYIAAAGHDLRQPLHALTYLAQALLDRQPPQGGERELLRRLVQAAGSTDRMFQDLLQLAQIDSTRLTLSYGRVELAGLFDSLQTTFLPQARRKGLVLEVYRTDEAVQSDAVALMRILNNLVSNAIRYTSSGLVEVRARERYGKVLISVRDTGPGIAPEDQPSIFDEFHRLRPRPSGTGLGLAIVRRLASALGHELAIRSAVGKGTRFSLQLERAEPLAPDASQAVQRPIEERLILFVDDDSEVRRAVRPVMESWGYTVVDAGSGEEAEEKLAELMTVPAVMVVDHDLAGGESAQSVVQRIRRAYGKDIPSLLVTGNPESQPLDGAEPPLLKPVAPAQLRAAVERTRRDGGTPADGDF